LGHVQLAPLGHGRLSIGVMDVKLSASCGFIALFGMAVLNGVVLIGAIISLR
jgi:Cu/Ag efflux pump CusA